MAYALTHSKIDWLTRKIFELLDYRYTTDQIYTALEPLLTTQDVTRYKFLSNFYYHGEKELLEQELLIMLNQEQKA